MVETIISKYPEDGICYPRISLNIRSIPCASTGIILDQYHVGESVIYDQVVITDKYVWISWLSTSGRRVYMAIKDQITGERFGDCADIPNSSVGVETIVQEYPENGICYPRITINIRDLPCTSTGTILDQYYQGESVIYDYVVITNKYVWISWISRSGSRRYMAVKDQITGERFGDCGDVPGGMGESNTPTGVETIVSEYPESGICYPQMTINIKNIPCSTMGVTLDQYHLGESVIYDYVVITNKYVWISWTSISGRRVYMTVKDQVSGERWGNCTDISGDSGSSGGSSGIGMPGVKKIFIDAGHGGSDPGALGNGLKEKDIVLSISQKLTRLFNSKGIQVSNSRHDDVSVGLSERADMANRWGADLFISIHANALDGSGSAYGTECYTHPGSSAENKRLALDIASSISNKLGTYNRGCKEADFAVLRLSNMPAVLVETAFIDNSGDSELLNNRQDDFANAIFTAVIGTGNINPGPNPGPSTPEEEQMLKDIVAVARRYRESTGNGNNIEMINKDILDYLRAYKYSTWKWDIILGTVSTFFEYVVNENPELHTRFYPYIKADDTKLFQYKGHIIDLPHLAATTLGYYESKFAPDFWSGWGADLATTMQDIQKYKENNSNYESDYYVSDAVFANDDYQFSVEDIKADIDAIHFSSKLRSDSIDVLFEIYYVSGYYSRKSLIEWDIDRVYSMSKPQNGSRDLTNRIYQIMIGAKGFNYISIVGDITLGHFAKYKGKMPNESEKKAACNAFAKYIMSQL